MRIKLMVLSLAVLSTSATAENALDVNLSGDAVRGEFSYDVGTLPNNNAEVAFGALFSDENEDSDFTMIHGGLLVTGDAGAADASVIAGLGLRAAGFDADGLSGGAVAVGGEVDARLPQYNRIGVGASVYFAPDASSFSDVSGYLEFGVNANYELIRNGFVYLGYRNIELDVNDVDVTVDNGILGGFKVKF